MPIEPDRSAAARARDEAAQWMEIAAAADAAAGDSWNDVAPTEVATTGVDVAADLLRRTQPWHHVLPSAALSDIARFGAGLAKAEAEAWELDHPQLAMRAYEDRRFLVGDRVLPWAVPWLDAVGRCYHDRRAAAHAARDQLLALGDEMRPAPVLVEGSEGLHAPGEDSLGAVDDRDLDSLLSGVLLLAATLRSLTGRPGRSRAVTRQDLAEPVLRSDLALLYQVAAARWRSLAERHPGSARLWIDLAARAGRTSGELSAAPPS